MDSLTVEVQDNLKHGMRQVSVAQFCAEFAALGYRLGDACDGTSRNLTTGNAYPERTFNPIEEGGRSAFHFEARRDANFKAMQALRNEIFAVHNGRIYSV